VNQQIIWIGNHSRREFVRITRSLEVHSSVAYYPTVDAVPATLAPPPLFCYAWSRQAEFEVADMQHVASRFPSSRHLNVLGELCCGMKRTSQKLQSVAAVYAHELIGELTLARMLRQVNLDLTDNAATTFHSTDPNKLVAIYSRSGSYREAIAESLLMLKLKTIQMDPHQPARTSGVDYVVWDATDSWSEFPDFASLRKRHPVAKMIALVASPREYEISYLEENGIQVLAQPYRLRDLFSIFGSRTDFLATSAA